MRHSSHQPSSASRVSNCLAVTDAVCQAGASGANGLALNSVSGFRERVCRWMAVAIHSSFAGFLQSVSNEQFARQELNALKVDSRKLCAIPGIRGAKHRSPECRVIGPPRAEVGVNVLGNRVDGGDGKCDQEFDD